MPYTVTIFDMFHPGDEDAAWDGGTYWTAVTAIASVKSGVDYELRRFWDQEVAAGGKPTVQGLVSDIHHFAELPVAFGPDGRTIFDSEAYAAKRAAAMVAAAERAPSAKRARDVRVFIAAVVFFVSVILLALFGPRQ